MTKNRVFGMGQKMLSPYEARGKNFFRILGNDEKHLRGFDEEFYHREREERGDFPKRARRFAPCLTTKSRRHEEFQTLIPSTTAQDR
jgi:hypothetical protein